MISYSDWIRQIVSTCELICSKEALRLRWLQNDKSITSIYSYDELYEQLVGDLDFAACLVSFSDRLKAIGCYGVVSDFWRELNLLDEAIEKDSRLQDSRTLLESSEWKQFQGYACEVAKREYFK